MQFSWSFVVLRPYCMLLFFVSCLLCSSACFSQKTYAITYRGHKFEFGNAGYDTLSTIDPATNTTTYYPVKKDPWPIKMDGKRIYRSSDTDAYTMSATALKQRPGWNDTTLRDYLLDNLATEFTGLPDLKYKLSVTNLVIDQRGRIAYFEKACIIPPRSRGAKEFHLAKSVQDKIARKIRQMLLAAPARDPAVTYAGVPVPWSPATDAFAKTFTIKNHKVIAQ